MRGESTGGVGGDGSVPVEFGGFVGVAEQGEHRDGDQHPGHDLRVPCRSGRRRGRCGGRPGAGRRRCPGPVARGCGGRVRVNRSRHPVTRGVRGVGVGEPVEAVLDGVGAFGVEVEAEPGHSVGGGFEHDPAFQDRGAVSGVQRFGVQAFPQGAEPAAEGGVGLLRCPFQRGGFERGRGVGREPGEGLEDRAELRQADRPGGERLQGGGVSAGRRRVGDQGAGGAARAAPGRWRVRRGTTGCRTPAPPGTDPSCTPSTACAYPCARSISRNCSACAARIRRSSATIASRSACSAARRAGRLGGGHAPIPAPPTDIHRSETSPDQGKQLWKWRKCCEDARHPVEDKRGIGA